MLIAVLFLSGLCANAFANQQQRAAAVLAQAEWDPQAFFEQRHWTSGRLGPQTSNAQFVDRLRRHFDQFGYPEEQQFEAGPNFLVSRSLRTKMTNWILEWVGGTPEQRERAVDFGHRNARVESRVQKLLAAMDECARCFSNRLGVRLLALTGAMSLTGPDSPRLVNGRKVWSHWRQYAPPPTHLFKVLLLEQRPGQFCADMLWTGVNSELSASAYDSGDCRKSQLEQPFGHRLFSNSLEFVEWHIGRQMGDLLRAMGVQQFHQGQVPAGISGCRLEQNVNNRSWLTQPLHGAMNTDMDVVPSFENLFKRQRQGGHWNDNNSDIRVYEDYMVSFNRRLRIPNWVLEEVSGSGGGGGQQQGTGERFLWAVDAFYAQRFQPTEMDYWEAKNFQLNHGHMAPLHNHAAHSKSTFLYTNSTPQNSKMNAGHWRVIEEYARCIGQNTQGDHTAVFVYSGPMFLARDDVTRYLVVGEREMAVPTHFFKVLLVQPLSGGGECWLESFVVPNADSGPDYFDGHNGDRNKLLSFDQATGTGKKRRSALRELVGDCRRKSKPLEYGNERREVIRPLLAHYAASLRSVERNSEFRLLSKLGQIAGVLEAEGGVEFVAGEAMDHLTRGRNGDSWKRAKVMGRNQSGIGAAGLAAVQHFNIGSSDGLERRKWARTGTAKMQRHAQRTAIRV